MNGLPTSPDLPAIPCRCITSQCGHYAAHGFVCVQSHVYSPRLTLARRRRSQDEFGNVYFKSQLLYNHIAILRLCLKAITYGSTRRTGFIICDRTIQQPELWIRCCENHDPQYTYNSSCSDFDCS